MITFEMGDFVKDSSGIFVGVVCGEGREHEGRLAWEVYWNDGDTRQIHTRETLYSMYKDTNLYDTDDSSLNEWGDNFESFNELLDHLSFNDENAFNGMFDNEVYRNDNMTIQRIY